MKNALSAVMFALVLAAVPARAEDTNASPRARAKLPDSELAGSRHATAESAHRIARPDRDRQAPRARFRSTDIRGASKGSRIRCRENACEVFDARGRRVETVDDRAAR